MSFGLAGRTSRLELADATLREWDAFVLAAGPDGIVLDRSAFYPGGGGQPPDRGVLLWGGVQTGSSEHVAARTCSSFRPRVTRSRRREPRCAGRWRMTGAPR